MLWKKNELSGTHSELYMADGADEQAAYDKLNRLVEFQRGTLSDAVGSDGYYDTVSTSSRQQVWDLDALGNWDSLANDGGSAQTRTHDAQNRITAVNGATSPTHSANGEMTGDETGQTLKYDAWGRIVEINTDGTGAVEITYAYDALHRRIDQDGQHLYYSDGWQVLEERNSASAAYATHQYVWSPVYVDAMVLRDRDANASNDGMLEERLYVTHDANFNVTALVDTGGVVQERFIYDPYGTRSVLDANWAADANGLSDYTFLHGHQGGRHDLEAGLVHFRNRDLDTSLGRWTRQDPLGFVDGPNTYVFVSSTPLCRVDPSGLIGEVCTYTGAMQVDEVKYKTQTTFICKCEYKCLDYDLTSVPAPCPQCGKTIRKIVWLRDPSDDWGGWDSKGNNLVFNPTTTSGDAAQLMTDLMVDSIYDNMEGENMLADAKRNTGVIAGTTGVKDDSTGSDESDAAKIEKFKRECAATCAALAGKER